MAPTKGSDAHSGVESYPAQRIRSNLAGASEAPATDRMRGARPGTGAESSSGGPSGQTAVLERPGALAPAGAMQTGAGPQGVRGSNQSGMRAHNERLVLTLLRRLGPQPKAEIARLTGLSAQTVSVIMRALEGDGLIGKGEKQRGKVGQPSVPMHLVPEGAFFFGLKVGRRSLELVLVDFVGHERGRALMTHTAPSPEAAVGFVTRCAPDLAARLSPAERKRIAGLGIGLPFFLWDWADLLGVPADEMAIWRSYDLAGVLAEQLALPVFVENDASAACNAEIVFGGDPDREGAPAKERPQDFLYAYIGYFVGGGLVLNGALVTGRTGNAGAIGPMPVPSATARGGSVPVIQVASLSRLEARLAAAGHPTASIWEDAEHWDVDADLLEAWMAETAHALAHVAASAVGLLDLEALVIDGWMPAALRARLVDQVVDELSRIDLTGTMPLAVRAGTVGSAARALGAASIPLARRFMAHPNALAL